MRSVPLNSLINNGNDNLRYFSKAIGVKSGFRISSKQSMGQKTNESLDDSQNYQF